MTHKYYKRLAFSLKPALPETNSFIQSAFVQKLRRPQTMTPDGDNQEENETVSSNKKLSKARDLIGRVALHATPLMQFYSPFVAAGQKLVTRGDQIDTTLILPAYVHAFQIGLRLLLLIPCSLLLSLAFGNSKCLFSRFELNYSYECLNEFDDSHEGYQLLVLGGLIAALFVAPICFHVSNSIFKNYTAYLAKFELPDDIKPME